MTTVFPANAAPQSEISSAPLDGGDGDWRQWDAIWNGAQRPDVIYTRGEPQTLTQLMHRAYFEDLWHFLGEPAPGAKFLELGSGRGTMSMYLAERGCDVTLLDRSPAALALARVYFAQCGLPAPQFMLADAANSGLKSESFDCIYNTGVLEHFRDPAPLLAEAMRLLKPGGLLFMIVVPQVPWTRGLGLRLALNPLPTLGQAAKQLVKRAMGSRPGAAGGVRTAFSREHWRDALQSAGGQQVMCLAYNPLHQVYRSAALERAVALPIFKRRLSRRRRRGRYPLLQTRPSLARCDLLVGRKP